MSDKKRVLELVKPLIDYYKQDKIRLIKLCLKKGIEQQEIAEALEVSEEGISLFIKFNNIRGGKDGRKK